MINEICTNFFSKLWFGEDRGEKDRRMREGGRLVMELIVSDFIWSGSIVCFDFEYTEFATVNTVSPLFDKGIVYLYITIYIYFQFKGKIVLG